MAVARAVRATDSANFAEGFTSVKVAPLSGPEPNGLY